ncbi:MAG: hypothetical protein M1457_06145, partial [bacterium]|nr:hypothetical protein [bacterium]
ARDRGRGAAAGQRLRLGRGVVDEQFAHKLLFDHDASGLDALEIFRLKWALFAQVCAAVHEYHRRTGAPHLRLGPRHVMVNIEPGGLYLPSLWRFQARLVSLGSPTLELRWGGETPEIFVPPTHSDPLYDAELVRNSSFGLAQRGDFLLVAVDEAPGGRAVIRGQTVGTGIGLRWLSLKDRVLVTLGRHLVGDASVELLATRDEAREYSPRVIHIRSLPLPLEPPRRAALEKLRGIRVPNAVFRLLPALHVPCDLYSLGILLYRTLLVNDGQGIAEVVLALEDLRQDLASLAAIECEEGQEAIFWDRLLKGHRRPEVAEVFGRRQIFFHENERIRERPNAIPAPLWNEAMLLGLQLVTQFENFSFCANHGDFDPAVPSARIEPLMRRVEEMGRRIDTALFGLTARNAEVRQALERVLREAGM